MVAIIRVYKKINKSINISNNRKLNIEEPYDINPKIITKSNFPEFNIFDVYIKKTKKIIIIKLIYSLEEKNYSFEEENKLIIDFKTDDLNLLNNLINRNFTHNNLKNSIFEIANELDKLKPNRFLSF